MHRLESFLKNKIYKILWNFEVQFRKRKERYNRSQNKGKVKQTSERTKKKKYFEGDDKTNLVRASQKFYKILLCASLQHGYHMTEEIQSVREVSVVGGSIMVVGVLACHALLHFVCDLKLAQMNMQHSLIWELMFYKFKQRHNAMETTRK